MRLQRISAEGPRASVGESILPLRFAPSGGKLPHDSSFAIAGAILTCLRWRSATGPLQAGPLPPWHIVTFTRGLLLTIFVGLEMEIGNAWCSDVCCMHLPFATTWPVEQLGGEPTGQTSELSVHGVTGDIKDEGLGARVRSCAIPIPIIVSRVPCPSSTRFSVGRVSSGAFCVGEETTLGATRCADCTLLLAGVGGTSASAGCTLPHASVLGLPGTLTGCSIPLLILDPNSKDDARVIKPRGEASLSCPTRAS